MGKIRLQLITFNATLSAFIFGYQLSALNSSVYAVQSTLGWGSLKTTLFAVATALMPFGALVGSQVSVRVANAIGRRKFLLYNDLLIWLGSVINAIPTTPTFMIGRFLAGCTVGNGMTIAPLYLYETMPPEYLGRLGSFIQVQIGLGQTIATGLCLIFIVIDPDFWILVFAFPIVIGIVQGALFIFAFKHETISWLEQNGHADQAAQVRLLMKPDVEIKDQGSDLMLTPDLALQNRSVDLSSDSKLGWRYESNADLGAIFTNYRRAIMIGITFAAFYQLAGINLVGFFSTEIFIMEGYASLAPLITVITGVVSIFGGFLGYCAVDRYGRRTLALFGFTSMFICLAVVGVFSFLNISFIVSAIFIMLYILTYCTAVGFVFWIYISDTLPDTGVGFASAVSWVFTILIALVWPFMLEGLGNGVTFIIFAGLNILGILFVKCYVVETKGKSAWEIYSEINKIKE